MSRAYLSELIDSGDPIKAAERLKRAGLLQGAFRALETSALQTIATRVDVAADKAEQHFAEVKPAVLARLDIANEVKDQITQGLKDLGDQRKSEDINIANYGEVLKPPKSYSFAEMDVDRHVGGVVFGRPPENPMDALDFRDITWTTSNQTILLHLDRGDGQRITIGPFDRQIIHQALAYAADGRKVPATVLNTSPLSDQKVTIHPALLDTPSDAVF